MESGILGFGIFNSGKAESGIPLTIGIPLTRIPESRTCNPESTAWHQQSKTVLDYLTLGDTVITYPSPKPTFCPKGEVSANVGLGGGGGGGLGGQFLRNVYYT